MACKTKTLDGITRITAADTDIDGDLEVDNLTVNNNATVGNDVSVGNDLDVGNQLILNSTVEPQILSNNVGLCWGTAGSSAGAGRFHNIVIGEDCTTPNGDNNIAIGLRARAEGITGIAFGSDCVTTGTQSTVAIGWSTNVSASQGTAVGPNADVSANGGSAYGCDSSASGTNSIAIGDSASASGASGGAIGQNANSTADNAWAIGTSVSNTVADSALLFDNTMTIGIGWSLFKGATNDVWTDLNGPLVSSAGLYTQNAVTYTMTADETVNGILRNTYNSGVSTVTWPSRTTIVNYLENTVSGTPVGGTSTRHSSWKTTVINTTAQTVTFVAGANQTALGTSFSAGIGANECVTFESYLTGSSYITVRSSTQAI